jgi:hypothetical protein
MGVIGCMQRPSQTHGIQARRDWLRACVSGPDPWDAKEAPWAYIILIISQSVNIFFYCARFPSQGKDNG